MIRYLYADQLPDEPDLARSMFQDRAAQFAMRLGWDVRITSEGEERDQYDALNPLYVIWQGEDGRHGGQCGFCRQWAAQW